MKRKSAAILVALAVAGVGATLFLVMLLFGSDDAQRARDPSDGSGRRGTSADRTSGGRALPGSNDPRPGRGARTGIASKTVPPGTRTPEDGADWQRQLKESRSEILRLLGDIPAAANQSKRVAMFHDLKKHIRLLGHRLDRSVRNQLIALLDTAAPQWRRLVGDALGNLEGDVETAKILLEKHKSKPQSVHTRQAILLALGNMKVDEVLPELLGTLKNNYPDESLIVDAIGRIGGVYANQALFSKLEGPVNSATRTAIERILRDQAHPELLDKMAADLNEADPRTQLSYLAILGRKGRDQYAPQVRKLLETATDDPSRSAAIRALGQFGDRESAEVLLDLIQKGGGRHQSDATRALYSIRNAETVNQLAENWEKLDTAARGALIGAGARLSNPGEKLVAVARDGLSDPDPRVRNSSARLLGQKGRDDNVEPLTAFIERAQNPGARNSAFQSLRKIGTEKAADRALGVLHVIPNEKQRKRYQDQFRAILDRFRDIRGN